MSDRIAHESAYAVLVSHCGTDTDRVVGHVLAALAKAGRLVPEVGEDVENIANKAAWSAAEKHKGEKIPLRDAAILFVAVNAAAPIISADSERRVRAEIHTAWQKIVNDPRIYCRTEPGEALTLWTEFQRLIAGDDKCSTP